MLVWVRDLTLVFRASDCREYSATAPFFGEQESVRVVGAWLLKDVETVYPDRPNSSSSRVIARLCPGPLISETRPPHRRRIAERH